MKLCKACGQEKPTSEFHKDKSKSDGLNAYCKPCHITRQKSYDERPGKFIIPEGCGRCQCCKKTKPADQFHNSKRYHGGLDKYCKQCRYERLNTWRRENLSKAAAQSKRWRETNPRLARDHKLKSRYGIPLGTYERLFTQQEGRCAICQRGPNGKGDFHVDHCHETGRIRGLLCHGCNVSIGHLNHDPQLLLRAASYCGRPSPEGY